MDIRKHFVMTIVAAPRQGKTHLITYLLYDLVAVKKMFNTVVVVTNTPHYYYGIIPEQFIYDTFNDDKMKRIELWQNSHPDSELLLIFDDFKGMIRNFHDQNSALSAVLTCYRHPNTHFSCIFAVHLANHISPTVRTITTYWVVFRQKDEKSTRILHECAGYEFPNFKAFKDEIDKKLVKPTFLLVDKEEDGLSMYKYMRAPAEIPKFTLKY